MMVPTEKSRDRMRRSASPESVELHPSKIVKQPMPYPAVVFKSSSVDVNPLRFFLNLFLFFFDPPATSIHLGTKMNGPRSCQTDQNAVTVGHNSNSEVRSILRSKCAETTFVKRNLPSVWHVPKLSPRAHRDDRGRASCTPDM